MRLPEPPFTILNLHPYRHSFYAMSPRNSPPPSDPSRRGEQRLTLPPIRQLFGQELSESIPPRQARTPSSSPHIPFHRLALQDEDRRYASPSPLSGHRGGALTSSHSYPSLQRSASSSGHPRNASDPPYRPQAYGAPQQYPPHGHPHGLAHPSGYPPQMVDGNAMASGAYPYSTQHHQSIPLPGFSAASSAEYATERSSKYECSYCGKGFTRPSSLKIHLNTHTGEKPFTCPFPGCGRSFSVQSNMRRHARVHTRADAAQADMDEESMEESDGQHSSDGEGAPPAGSSKDKNKA